MDNWKKCVLPDIGKQLYESIPKITAKGYLDDTVREINHTQNDVINAITEQQTRTRQQARKAEIISICAIAFTALDIVVSVILYLLSK